MTRPKNYTTGIVSVSRKGAGACAAPTLGLDPDFKSRPLPGAQPAMRRDICIIYDAAGTPIATLDPDTRVRTSLTHPSEARQP